MSRSVSDVSVVTVNWNGRSHLEALLPSVLALRPSEVIVVDNGSRDGSVEFLRTRFPEVRLLVNDRNRGFAEPNNLAAQEAQGSTLAFINNDMRCHPDWLEAGLEGLESAACVASRILNWEGDRIDYNGGSLQYLGYALQMDMGVLLDRVTRREKVLFPCGGAMLIDRDTFLKVGGFDPDFFAIFEDVDLGWRLWLAGYEVHLRPDSLVYHRGHGTFRSHAEAKMRYLMHRNALMTIIKNYSDVNLRAILPLAVILAVRRAVRLSGVERESFYLWAEAERRRASAPFEASDLQDCLSHLVSVDDVLARLPDLLARRMEVQRMRRRTDEEILALFQDPLRPIVEDGDFIRRETELIEMLGLDLLFDTRSYRSEGDRFSDPAAGRLRKVEEELRRLQWIGGHALGHPPAPDRRSRFRRFADVWRAQGPAEACRRAWEALRRGV